MRVAGNLVIHFTEFTLSLLAVFFWLRYRHTRGEIKNVGTNQTGNDIADTLIVTT
jgi:hypothetical protein